MKKQKTGWKQRAPLCIIFLLAFFGALELLFLWDTERTAVFYAGNLIFHVPLLFGFAWLCFKGTPARRFHMFWTPLGLLMIIWPTLTVIFADLSEWGFFHLFFVSETFWYGWAFGALIAFYSIKSLGNFWYFLLPIAIFWNVQHIFLLLQAAGAQAVLAGGAPTLASYFGSGKFWNDWGWFLSDMIVDVPIAAISAAMIILGVFKKVR